MSWRGMIGIHGFVDTNNSKGFVRAFVGWGRGGRVFVLARGSKLRIRRRY